MPAVRAGRVLRWLCPVTLCAGMWLGARPIPLGAQTDLDAFMRQALVSREDNWKKLQQYILDERESLDLRGPGRLPLWGERREYTWYIRDGFFIRSPLKVNGATIGEADRRKFEAEYLAQQQRRDRAVVLRPTRDRRLRPFESPREVPSRVERRRAQA